MPEPMDPKTEMTDPTYCTSTGITEYDGRRFSLSLRERVGVRGKGLPENQPLPSQSKRIPKSSLVRSRREGSYSRTFSSLVAALGLALLLFTGWTVAAASNKPNILLISPMTKASRT